MKNKIYIITTSHNQERQVLNLFDQISSELSSSQVNLIVTESGSTEYFIPKRLQTRITILKTHSDSYWAESTYQSLRHYFELSCGSSLIIANCDVTLENYKAICQLTEPSTFYTINPKTKCVERSGFNIKSWTFAIHSFPFLNDPVKIVKKSYVDAIPTRFLYIPENCVSQIKNIYPNFIKLPHYGSDYEFTYRLAQEMKKKWLISSETFLIEDNTTTGLKIAGSNRITRIRSIFHKKSIFRPKDRYNYAIQLSKNKSYVYRFTYTISNLIKLIIQILLP